jgi:prophage tail gpP-like protein
MKIKIDGQFFNAFTEVRVDFSLGSVASEFSFSARFNPDNLFHRKVFQPLAYLPIQIYSKENRLLLTGTIMNIDLGSNSSRQLQRVSGYSKSGVIEDCSIPLESYPLERINVSLTEISRSLIKSFGLTASASTNIAREMAQIYPKTVASPSESVKSFLSKLASQRNIILGHTAQGELHFFKLDIKQPSKFFFNQENTLSMSLSASGQSFFSQISVIRQPSSSNNVSLVDTVSNPLVGSKIRTLVKVLSSGTATDTKKAADSVLASQLQSLSITARFERIIDASPGDIVEVENPELHIYSRTKFVISRHIISQKENSENSEVTLVLPEAFTGGTPKNIFE